MAQTFMRNKLTGEFKDVEPDSPEFRELQAEVTPQGQPMWEQTSFPHAGAIKERAAYDELLEEDLGHEDQRALMPEAIRLDLEGVAPEANPHLALTPGEIEAGLTPQQKLDDLQAQYDEGVLGKRRSVLSEAADRIADERKERPAPGPAKGQQARAGGSDEREGVPRPTAQDEEHSGDSSSKGSSAGQSQRSAPAASGGGES